MINKTETIPRDIQDETFSRSEEDGVCGRCGLSLYRHRGRPLLPPQPCGASSAMTSPSVTLNTMIALYPPGPRSSSAAEVLSGKPDP